MPSIIIMETEEIITISHKYQKLSDEKKRKILDTLDQWIKQELNKLK